MESPRSSTIVVRCRSLIRSVLFLLPATLLMGLCVAFGAEFWEKKELDTWSAQECTKMLSNSPWAYDMKLVGMADQDRGGKPTEVFGGETGVGGQPFILYNVQLRSALPVRMAVVRQLQIANKYDSLSAEQKQAFDQSAKAFLDTNYSDKIVVNVAYSSNVRDNYIPLAQHWQTRTKELLMNSVFLYASKGNKLRLIDFNVAQGGKQEFQFVFPRMIDGKPILTPEDKSLILEFPIPVIGKLGDGKGFVEFKVKKMIIGQEVVY